MKPASVNPSSINRLLALACITSTVHAETATKATKATTGTDLTLAASWSGGSGPGFPTSADVATWESSSLGAGLTAATAVNWGSVNITGATANISIAGAGQITTGNITLVGLRTLTISNAIALSGNSTCSIADVTANANNDALLSGGISGTGFGITKMGAGTMALSGANSYTGDTIVNGGILALTYTSQNNDKIAPGAALTLGGGSLTVNGHATLATTQSVASTTLNPGSATLTVNKGAATQNTTLNFNGITRNVGGSMSVVYGGAAGAGIATATTTNTNDATGILGPWASFGTGAGTQYATVSSGNIAAYTTGTTAATAADLTDTTGTVNYNLTDATGTVPATVSANTIRYAGAAATTAPGATSFTVNGLMNVGTGVWTIGTNPLTIGASQDLIVNTANNGITLSSGIANNGAGTSALTKTGANILTLSGVNTYTGKTTVGAGTLAFTTADSLYSSTTASWTKENITVNTGATLALNTGGAGEFTGPQLTTLFSNLTTSINNNGLCVGSTVNLNATASTSVTTTLTDSTGTGGGALHLTKAGAGNLNLDNSTFSGNFITTGGVITITGSSSLIGRFPTASINCNSSALRQSAGTLRVVDSVDASVSGSGGFITGGSTYASYELSGGRLEMVNPWRVNPRNSQITQTGGVVDISYTGNGADLLDGRQFIIGTGSVRGVIYATGGTATITTNNLGASPRAALNVSDTTSAATSGGGELTLAGTADWSLSGNAGYVAITRTSGKYGNLNLNGNSVLTANRVVDGGGIAGLNFDGGTLRAAVDNTGFLTGLDWARIYPGGAKIDTNGKNITIGQSLTNPSGNVVTSIPVTNAGSGYTGAPIVSINGNSGATAVANYDPVAGTVTSITITSPGSGYGTAPTVSLVAGSGNPAIAATLGAATVDAAPGTGALTKLGTGTLTLNASAGSTYAGGTTVNAGTLLANNSTGSATGTGTVLVKNTATFGGTGAVSGAVILESGGTLAPGASIESLATGALTLPAGATLAAEIDSSGTPAADVVNVTGALTLGGALTVTDIAGIPAAIPLGTKLTLITYSGTLTGTFSGKAEGSTFAVGGNTFKIRYADSNAVTLEAVAAGTGYAGWASTNAPGQTDAQDYDNDGVSNGVEYVLGGSATTNDAGKLPTGSIAGGNFIVSFVRYQDSKTPDTAVSIQMGTTLATWPDVYSVPNTGTLGPVVVTDNGNGTDTVTLTVTQAPDAKKFARLNVVITP